MVRKFIAIFAVIFSVSCTPINSNAKGLPHSFADLVENLIPAVVNISTTQKIKESNRTFQFSFPQMPKGSPFEEFNEFFDKKDPNRKNGDGKGRKVSSLGSGFIIDKAGYVVTNNHVVDDADEITVIFSDDTSAKAKVIGRDKKTDLALLKVDVKRDLPYVKFGDSDESRIGDWVIAIGNPFGLGESVTAGIISAQARDINAGPFDDFIQTDAAINKGNSGGPMFNIDGEVIGINTAIYSPSGGSVGIGFAVPAALAKPIIKQLRDHGHAVRGWLGVKIQNVTEEIADSVGLGKANGALVVDVNKATPAGKGGIQSGDIILEFDGKSIPNMKKLPRIVAETTVGKEVDVVVWRQGKKKNLKVELGELKEAEPDEGKEAPSGKLNGDYEAQGIIGLKVIEIDDTVRKDYSLEDGASGLLVMSVADGLEGIRGGDVIVSVNQQSIKDVNHLKSVISKARRKNRKSVLLLINRDGETIFVAASIDAK